MRLHNRTFPITLVISVALICLMMLSVTPVLADGVGFQGGVGLMLGLPQGEFGDNVDAGGGIKGHFGVHMGDMPLMFGAELGYLIYGSETRTVPFSLTIPDVMVDVETNNNIFLGHLLLRLQSPQGKIRPYADGLLGFNYLFTKTSVKDRDDHDEDDDIASSTNFDDTAFSYGLGGGLMYQVYASENVNGSSSKIFVDIGARYLIGSKAEYLEEGAIDRNDNGTIKIHPTSSKTDLFTIYLGVTISSF